MKQTFTKLLFCFLAIQLLNPLSAQTVLEISAPAEAAGSFDAALAGFFSGCIEGPVEGELVLTDPADGCNLITTDVAGKVAVIDRGECPFVTKALNAQDAGAIAVVICNNVPGEGLVNPSGDPDRPVTIPIIFLSYESCQVFRTSIPLTGTIKIVDRNLNVLWGDQAGQGDFAGGLNDWTSRTIECNGQSSDYEVWQWNENAQASRNSFQTGRLDSPTSCNGAMLFESDFYDNNGDAVNNGQVVEIALGSGPCPSRQIGELISPTIDISGADVSTVALSFYQEVNNFGSTFLIGYSTNGGETWTDIEINGDLEVRETASEAGESFQLIQLPGAEGASSLKIRFRMEADYYFWLIDDVKIVEGYQNDLIITEAFYTPISAIQPDDYIPVDTFLFQVSVTNNGSQSQTDVKLIAEVAEVLFNGQTGTVGFEGSQFDLFANDPEITLRPVHIDSAIYNEIPTGIDTFLRIENLYPPELSPGFYIVSYQVIQSEEDEDIINNFEEIRFVVSDNFFAKELDLGSEISRDNDQGPHRNINLYNIPANTQENFVMDQVAFRSFALEGDGPLDGNLVTVYLLEATDDFFTDAADLTTPDITAGGTLETKAFAEYEFPQGAGQDYIASTPLENLDSETDDFTFALTAGKTYGVVTEYLENSGFIYQVYSPNSTSFTSFLIHDRWYSNWSGEDGYAPVIRMRLALSTSIDETPLPAGTMTVFPNPATDFVHAQFNFEHQIDATVTLASIDGKVIEYKNQSLLNESVEFNTSNLADGMYLLRVATEIGTKTEKFVVKKP